MKEEVLTIVIVVSEEIDGPMVECANVQCVFNQWFSLRMHWERNRLGSSGSMALS